MSYTLDTLKDRLGVTDTSHDAELQSSLMIGKAAVEQYLDRTLETAIHVESHQLDRTGKIYTRAYPISNAGAITIHSNNRHTDPTIDMIRYKIGVITLKSTDCDEVEIEYTGGLDLVDHPMLVEAMLNVATSVYQSLDSTASITADSDGISSINIPNVGSVSFAATKPVSGASGFISPMAALLLQPYKNEREVL